LVAKEKIGTLLLASEMQIPIPPSRTVCRRRRRRRSRRRRMRRGGGGGGGGERFIQS